MTHSASAAPSGDARDDRAGGLILYTIQSSVHRKTKWSHTMSASDPNTWLWRADPFTQILASWLQKLPPGGWEGNIFELQMARNNSARRHRQHPFVPSQNALGVRIRAEKAIIKAHGFELVALRRAT